MAGRPVKISAEQWVETARQALVEEGIAGVKIEHLAQRLGVSRGGFYANFSDREKILDRLLEAWRNKCRFLPDEPLGASPGLAVRWIELVVRRVIERSGYDQQFDMSVREWARSDQRVALAVQNADRERIAGLSAFFSILGYDDEESDIRARVFYFHQIGYFAIGIETSVEDRLRAAPKYLDILCGAEALAVARKGQPPA